MYLSIFLVSISVDCELGQWSKWTNCPKIPIEDMLLASDMPTQSKRFREIIQKDMHGGEACGNLTDTKPCPGK